MKNHQNSPTDRTAWDEAFHRYRDARALKEVYDREVFDPAFDREKAFEASHALTAGQPRYWERRKALDEQHNYTIPDHIGEEADQRSEAFGSAEGELMKLPAPDFAALQWKLDHLLDAHGDEPVSPWTATYIEQTKADYRRLLGEA